MGDRTDTGYDRTSTGSQDLENQIIARANWCMSNGIAPKDIRIYSDVISGITDVRPGLKELTDDIKAGKVKRVIVWRLDRLGRSLRHLISLMELFKKYDVAFVSIQEGFDTSTSTGKLMFHIVGAMAEFERCLIQERARMSILKRRAQGLRVGRNPGSGDLKRRKTNGYRLRYARKRYEEAKASYNLLPDKANLRKFQKASKQLEKYGGSIANPILPTKEKVNV